MSGTLHDLLFVYAAVALVVAVGAFVLADVLRSTDRPRNPFRLALAVIAGAVWPILVVGALQFAAIRVLTFRARPAHARQRADAPATPVGAPG